MNSKSNSLKLSLFNDKITNWYQNDLSVHVCSRAKLFRANSQTSIKLFSSVLAILILSVDYIRIRKTKAPVVWNSRISRREHVRAPIGLVWCDSWEKEKNRMLLKTTCTIKFKAISVCLFKTYLSLCFHSWLLHILPKFFSNEFVKLPTVRRLLTALCLFASGRSTSLSWIAYLQPPFNLTTWLL